MKQSCLLLSKKCCVTVMASSEEFIVQERHTPILDTKLVLGLRTSISNSDLPFLSLLPGMELV